MVHEGYISCSLIGQNQFQVYTDWSTLQVHTDWYRGWNKQQYNCSDLSVSTPRPLFKAKGCGTDVTATQHQGEEDTSMFSSVGTFEQVARGKAKPIIANP